MLTMAVFAICITAPLGAIFINTLGPMWLEKEEDVEEELFEQGKKKTLRTGDQVDKDRKDDED